MHNYSNFVSDSDRRITYQQNIFMNILSSTFLYKCPKCRKGDLFAKPFHFKRPLDMPKRCEFCKQKFEPQPGYYFGAMFVSYILTSFLFLSIALSLIFYFGWSYNLTITIVIILGIILYFKVLRLSRSIWIHLDVKYDPRVEK
jgi:uncharacterized protein (DUF983 family)